MHIYVHFIIFENKISEIDDFCGISVRIARATCMFSSNADSILRSIMNDLIYRINSFNIFNLCKIAVNRFVETWLNVSFTSRTRHKKTFFEFFAFWISCNRYKTASIANRFFVSYLFIMQQIWMFDEIW